MLKKEIIEEIKKMKTFELVYFLQNNFYTYLKLKNILLSSEPSYLLKEVNIYTYFMAEFSEVKDQCKVSSNELLKRIGYQELRVVLQNLDVSKYYFPKYSSENPEEYYKNLEEYYENIQF